MDIRKSSHKSLNILLNKPALSLTRRLPGEKSTQGAPVQALAELVASILRCNHGARRHPPSLMVYARLHFLLEPMNQYWSERVQIVLLLKVLQIVPSSAVRLAPSARLLVGGNRIASITRMIVNTNIPSGAYASLGAL